MKIFIIALIITPALLYPLSKQIDIKLKTDLEKLEQIKEEALLRLKKDSNFRSIDFLKLLPSASYGKNYYQTGFDDGLFKGKSEPSLNVAIHLSAFYDIFRQRREREISKLKAEKEIDHLYFKLQILIKRKYLLEEKLFTVKEILSNLKDPVLIRDMKTEALELELKVQTVNIEISEGFKKIEYEVLLVEM